MSHPRAQNVNFYFFLFWDKGFLIFYPIKRLYSLYKPIYSSFMRTFFIFSILICEQKARLKRNKVRVQAKGFSSCYLRENFSSKRHVEKFKVGLRQFYCGNFKLISFLCRWFICVDIGFWNWIGSCKYDGIYTME